MVKTNEERGVAGIIGGILAIAGPAVGLIAGIIISIVVQFLGVKNNKKATVTISTQESEA